MSRAVSKQKLFEAIGYHPHPKQILYHSATERFRVPVCGRRFGKSTMAGRDCEPELFLPNRMYWIAGPTYDLGEKEFRVIWDDLIIKLGLGKDKQVKKRYNKKQGDMFIEFPWGTRLEVRSAEHPENLVGEGLHGVIVSEAAKHRPDAYDRFLRPALADYRGWATFPTTPEGMNWLYKLWQFGRNPEFVDYVSWRFPSWDNPVVYPEGELDPEILLLKATMTIQEFDQEIAALFTAFVGRIYDDFQEDLHVQTVEYDPNLPNYIFWDWGFVNPLVALEVQITPSDEVRVWREHYRSHWILNDHLNFMMNDRAQPDGYKIDATFGDSADPEAVAQVNAYGIPCMAMPEAKENWRDGIELVKGFLRAHETGLTDEYGAPLYSTHLKVDHSCVNTIREFNNYKASRGTYGRNPRSAREEAQKVDDHAMDALRYGLMHIYRLGATYSLGDVEERPGDGDPEMAAIAGESSYSSEEGTFMTMNKEF